HFTTDETTDEACSVIIIPHFFLTSKHCMTNVYLCLTGSGKLTQSNEIVLVGKTGVGKSAAGNTILGREAFESDLSPSSLTSECKKAKGAVGGRQVAVVDTPGLFDTNFTQEEVLKRIKMCISLSAPGPHAFLVVLQLGRFTQEEQDTVRMIQTTFGEDAAKFTMVLFTHGDQLKNQTIEEFVSQSEELKAIIASCYGRYHVFNNEVKNEKQTYRLLDIIDDMTTVNGGWYYTNEMFMRAEEAIEKEKARLLKEFEEQNYWSALNSRFGFFNQGFIELLIPIICNSTQQNLTTCSHDDEPGIYCSILF
uniref:Zgc:152658 n=1 Tax=Myripristis murdjan TaxID=586833 RepID=A0A667XYG1_9TELE